MKDVFRPPDKERLLEVYETEIQCLENKNLKIRKSQDEIVNLKNVLCNHIVTKYRQMKTEYNEMKEKLTLTNIENVHFKSVAKYMENTIDEIIDCDDMDERSMNSCCSNDDALSLEEFGNALTNELRERKTRVEKLSKSLDHVREQLRKSEDIERRLKKRADCLETTRARRDRENAEWRSMDNHLLAELGDSRRAEDQLRAALDRLDDGPAVAVELADELRAETSRLTDELAARQTTEGVLRARFDELEALLCAGTGTPLGRPSISLLDPDQDGRGQSRNADPASLGGDVDGGSSELGRGDIGRVSRSPSADDVTGDRKPRCSSATSCSTDASGRNRPTARSVPVPEWFDAELLDKYLRPDEPAADDGDSQRPPTVPHLHMVQLIHKYMNPKDDAADDVDGCQYENFETPQRIDR